MFYVQVLRKYAFVFGLILNLILSSCATTPKLNQPKTSKTRLEQQTYKVEEVSPINESQIRKKLTDFKRALKTGKLSKKDWELHDRLLNAYIHLKSQQSNKITLPAHSQLSVPLETYCLNSGKAAPSKREIYRWQKSDPGIKYYKKLLELRRKNKIKKQELQELLWNLQNETRWDDYPNWLGPLKPKDSEHAESLFNIRKWGNDAQQIKAYVVKERVSGYAGRVAGGEGHQFLIPSNVPLDKVLVEVNF